MADFRVAQVDENGKLDPDVIPDGVGNGAPGEDGREVELRTSGGYIQWRYVGDASWLNLIATSTLTGEDGESPELRNSGDFVQWRLPSGSWSNLIAISEITGPQGIQGEPGQDGADGAGLQIIDTLPDVGSLPGTGSAGDGYLIDGDLYVWADSEWENVGTIQGPQGDKGDKGDKGDTGDVGSQGATGLPGSDGADGREIELRVNGGFIQWRHEGDSWFNLIATSTLTGATGADGDDGADGREIELRVSGGYFQWRYVGETWTNLIAVSSVISGISDVPGLQTALDAKAPLASPALTGTPTAPTAAGGTNTTQVATTQYVVAAIAALINSAPGALDTLDELAAALGDDPNFATTITNALALKAPLASPAFTGTPTGITKGHVGLGNVDNTADSAKSFTGTQVAAATTSARGTVELATSAEGNTGTDTDRAMTPAAVAALLRLPIAVTEMPASPVDGQIYFVYTEA